MEYPNKKCTFANRVVRRSKSQNISALALSLNRYHKSATPPFYSDIQSDTSFLIILCKDNIAMRYYGLSCSLVVSRIIWAHLIDQGGEGINYGLWGNLGTTEQTEIIIPFVLLLKITYNARLRINSEHLERPPDTQGVGERLPRDLR